MRIISWDDSTEAGQRATEVAIALAGRLGDAVCVVDAVERTDARGAETRQSRSSVAFQGEEHEAGGAAVAVETRRLKGTPEEFIRTGVATADARLIVAPQPGENSPQTGPAERVALSALVPTLTVREAAPLLAWARGERPLRVLCAHDLTTTGDEALAFFKTFCDAGDCAIVVVHAHRPLEEKARLGLPTNDGEDHTEEVQHILRRDLQNRVQRILGGLSVEVRVCPTPLRRDNALLELARQENADLIVAGTHQRHGIDRLSHPISISRALLRFAPSNVLLVPASRVAPPCRRSAVSRVLAATDLTWESNQAVPHAYALLPHGGTLRLLHVVHPQALPGGEFVQGVGPNPEHSEVLREAHERLRELVLGEADAPGVVTEIEVVEHREPATAIAQAAERFGADVVCMAAHTPNSVFGRLFKSQIQTVMAKSSRPLLVIHPPFP